MGGGEHTALKMLSEYASLGAAAFAERWLKLEDDGEGGLEQCALRRVLRAEVCGHKGGCGMLCPGEVFLRAFSTHIALGCLSMRRITTMCAGMREVHNVVEWREWHRLLAIHDLTLDPARADFGQMTYRYWQWNGFLVRYAAADDTLAQAATPLLLVHGFGTSATIGTLSLPSSQQSARCTPWTCLASGTAKSRH
ncbi:hypothetical protein CYMTET_56207 [Cymbomonas tetramitiformis]|uniref:Uncharacterized protein n=1 Tax=Cymbomonas tetramitiformis TaxID=36881 RepID=A0AAE0BCM4_9CHLO|nr:hypothetical protein CYMTET_56207 [Cymbomonas tetramitiformis]